MFESAIVHMTLPGVISLCLVRRHVAIEKGYQFDWRKISDL